MTVQTIIQNNKGTKGNTEVQNSPLVDKETYRIEGNHKCSKEKIPKNRRQRRTKREKQSDIHRSKIKIRSDNKKRKTKSWKEYGNLTTEANPWNAVYRLAAGKKTIDNNTPETPRLTNKGHKRNPQTHARILHPRRQQT
jgi:hypothetical protein